MQGKGRPKPIRIEDVAAAAGVSRTTASDALNGTGRVNSETRALVERTAAELGFTANHHARMLRGGRSGILGFVNSILTDGLNGASAGTHLRPPDAIDSASDQIDLEGAEYFTALLTSTSTAALARGYGVILLPPSPDVRSFDPMVADGVVLHDPVLGGKIADQLERRGTPLVTTGRIPGRPPDEGTWADSDIVDSTHRVLDHMHSRGARRIALISNPAIRSYTIDTVDAYARWVADHDMPSQVVTTDARASENAAYQATLDLFGSAEPPDAIFAPMDRLAIGAMHAARANGLSAPSDLLVAAGTDGARARAADPPITALEHDTLTMGHLVVDLLIERVENRTAEPEQIFVGTTLKVRESTSRE